MARKRAKTRGKPAKARAKVHKRARPVDWSKRKAPPEGSRLRERYEKSAVYRKRVRAAEKALKTRRKHEAAERRRLEREEKRAQAKELLGPLLEKVISKYREGASHGEGMKESRDAHANWYAAKMNLADFLPERDYMQVLEELSAEHDLDGLGWDILY